MGRCVRTGFVWVRHVNNSRNFDPRRPGDTCKAQLAELSKELLWIYSHLGQMAVNNWQNPPQMAVVTQKTIKKRQETCETNVTICCKEPKTNVSFCPKTFIMAEDPKANAVGEKCQKKEKWWPQKRICASRPERSRNLRNLGGTSVKPWRNLLQNLLAAQDGSAPENQRHHETWRTLVELWRALAGTLLGPWWNLARNLLAAQDGSALENHKSPKAILPRNL